MTTERVHILLLAAATGPWTLYAGQWMRRFEDDEGNIFFLVGPRT